MKQKSEVKSLHEISGYSLCVKSPYEETYIDSYREADAGEVFMEKLESLVKELYKKIKNANAKIVYGEEEKEVFEKARKFQISEGEHSKNSTNLDYLAKIKDWL